MKISQTGINLIKKYEGCKLVAYKCPAGVLTIGYGHTENVREGQKISQEQAEIYLDEDLKKFEQYVNNLSLPLNQNQFDALVSFSFNLGPGNLKTLVKNRTVEQIADAILLYNKAAGKELAGLTRRREEEKKLFLLNYENKGESTMPKEQIKNCDFPILKKGTSSYYVKILQALLNSCGYRLTVDHIFGENTYRAVISFQGLERLTKDGIVGNKTWNKLLS